MSRAGGTVAASVQDGRLAIRWPIDEDERGRIIIDTRLDKPLIAELGFEDTPILKDVDPVTFITVGTRVAPRGRPPEMSVFNTFFDSPAKRPHQTHRATLDLKRVRVLERGRGATIVANDLTAGPFSGRLEISVWPDSRLVLVEAVVSTKQDRTAFLYDGGMAAKSPNWKRLAWMDTEGKLQQFDLDPSAPDHSVAVRHRTILAEGGAGTIACFPPPHSFFFPRDLTDNLKTVWHGRDHRGLEKTAGFGVRQSETGGGAFVPWFNAPPGTDQRLGVFYLVSKGKAEDALRETLRHTRNDRFGDLPGHITFSSHWHMAIAMAALREQQEGKPRTTPDFVKMFKDMNVDVLHLAEFHGDGHPQDPGPLRLPEMESMFAECRRLSDDELTLLPGEEANVHLGLPQPGKHAGHWMYLFPRPVYWTMQRGPDQPFVEEDVKYGKVYHVGDRAEMLKLLEVEKGLAWTAHARIKASSWTPDIFRHEDFYKSDRWFGAAWKAMPADLSDHRLGVRVLDLLDDMANWGDRKYVLGEVDVFKLDHTHELFGHMNVNYLRLDRAPRHEDDWQPVLDALRGGRFFVTTGEVLIRDFTVGGKPSGASARADGETEVRFELDWTFPIHVVELISGDGSRVHRRRIDLKETSFGRKAIDLKADLSGRRWARLEVWDVAGNGAFTQPVWLEER